MNPPKIYGLIGYPVKHSLSPLMHNAAFQHFGINAKYRLFEVKPEDLEDFLLKDIEVEDSSGNPVFTKDILGFNITIPHKVRANEILEKSFPSDKDAYMVEQNLYYVKLSGAVNTVKRQKGALKYYNTDAVGFLSSLEYDLKFDTKDKTVLIIGCGGAGRAVIAALSWKNMYIKQIYVYDIEEKALSSAKTHFAQFPHLDRKLMFISGKDVPRAINESDLLVNASPAGMKENDPPVIDKKLLRESLYVLDVVYNRQTALIQDAKSICASGHAINGMGMLLYQGVSAFEIWTGLTAPKEVMQKPLAKESF